VRFVVAEDQLGDLGEGSGREKWQKMKEVFIETCHEILDIEVWEEEPVENKVVKLKFVVKIYKDKIAEV